MIENSKLGVSLAYSVSSNSNALSKISFLLNGFSNCKPSFKTLIEGIGPLVLEKIDFEYRETSILLHFWIKRTRQNYVFVCFARPKRTLIYVLINFVIFRPQNFLKGNYSIHYSAFFPENAHDTQSSSLQSWCLV